ncbi:ParB/RepB/Spo0J family partition protein [Streptomyces sp. NPDC005878]|uniref:ParB/RepB/Spo0J family partition protein n=1 Tax=Streptomyces sp. NPDC005878 TaxID=3157077 RepID=UPI00340DB194
MTSKAERLRGSSAFGAARRANSERARAFAEATGAGHSRSPEPVGTLRVPLAQLAHNPGNPRASLKAVAEMAESILVRDVLQPLTVVTREAFLAVNESAEDHEAIGTAAYVVIDGNRRLAGAKQAGVDDVPVHVDDSLAESAETILEAALIAAVQHEDLEPIDEARALQKLVEKHGSQRAVCRAIGKSSGFVTQRLALLTLTPELKQAVEDKEVPVRIARAVGKLPEQQQRPEVDRLLQEEEDRKRKAKAKDSPVADPRGAYPVSTPAEPDQAKSQGDGAPSARTEGAYPVSTSAEPSHEELDSAESRVPDHGSAYPVSTPASNAVSLAPDAAEAPAEVVRRPVVKMPWHDGDEVAQIVLTRMDRDQLGVLVKRLASALGNPE